MTSSARQQQRLGSDLRYSLGGFGLGESLRLGGERRGEHGPEASYERTAVHRSIT